MGFREVKAPRSLVQCKREHFSVRTLQFLRVARLSPPHSPSCHDQVGRRNVVRLTELIQGLLISLLGWENACKYRQLSRLYKLGCW